MSNRQSGFSWRSPNKIGQESWLYKELIEADLKRDMKRLQKEDPGVSLDSLKREHYSFGKLASWGLTAYTQLHLYKALCLVANHPDYFTGYLASAAYWSSHDPTFTMPALVMCLNQALLARSKHPFLINVRHRWTPFSKAVLILYGSGISMVLPQTYLISYLAFGTTHLLVTQLQQWTTRKPRESNFDDYLKSKGLL